MDLRGRQKGTKTLRRIKIAWWKLRNERRIILRHGSRFFVLTVPRTADGHFNGHMHPLPQLRGTRLGMTGRPIKASAYLDFAIIKNRIGKFQGIAIPSEYHRQGWAADMVRALLAHYPDVHFYNSSLNEMSGPLFMKLRAEMPKRIAPIRQHKDGGYEVVTSWRPGQGTTDA